MFTQDEHIDRFLNLLHAAEQQRVPRTTGESVFEGELKRSVTELVKAKGEPLVKFMPLILDKLVQLLVKPPVIAGQVGMVMFHFKTLLILGFIFYAGTLIY